MDLIILVIWLSIIGFVIWFLTTVIPMPAIYRTAIYVIAGLAVMLFLLRRFSGSVPNVLP